MNTVQAGLKELQDKLPPIGLSLEEAEAIHFYAGAAWILKILFSMQNMPPDHAAGIMQGLQEEVEIFYETDGGGKFVKGQMNG